MTQDLHKVGINLFLSIQKSLKPDFSIEVGAFDASFSKKMRRKLSVQNIFAFEAVPRNFEKFSKGLTGITYLNLAVSNQVGTTQILVQKHAPIIAENNSLLAQTNSEVKYEKVNVQATTLDSFFIYSGLIQENQSACLWLDVEGATNLVLEGSVNLLRQISSIYVEVELIEMWKNQWIESHVISHLENLGFILLMRDFEAFPNQENLIFVHKSFVPVLQVKKRLLRQSVKSNFYRILGIVLKLRKSLLEYLRASSSM